MGSYPHSSAALLTGLLTGQLAEAAGVLVGFATLLSGAGHYGSVLSKQPKRTREHITGLGFFTGVILGIGVLLFDIIN
jgi:hypothetical protein